MSLKVLQVVGVMNRGGAEAMLMDILRNKPENVHFDFLINNDPARLTDEGSFDKEILSYGCEMLHIGSQLRLGPIKYIRQFMKVVRELQPDVVHIHLNAKSGLIALAAKLGGVKKIIVHCHADIKFRGTLPSRIFNETEMWCQKWLIGWCATDFWGCSKEANLRLYRGKTYEKSLIVNNAISCEVYRTVTEDQWKAVRQSYNLPNDAVILGNVGRIVSHKGIAHIVDVLAVLHKRKVNAHFVVAGRNDAVEYVENMMTHAKKLGVDSKIHFLGERADIPVVMHTFDVFVGPALREGFGLVAVEAQAAAVPCVLFKGFPKTVNMNLGLVSFVDDFNPITWSDNIMQALAQKKVEKDLILDVIRSMGFDAKENAIKVCNAYALKS